MAEHGRKVFAKRRLPNIGDPVGVYPIAKTRLVGVTGITRHGRYQNLYSVKGRAPKSINLDGLGSRKSASSGPSIIGRDHSSMKVIDRLLSLGRNRYKGQ